MESSWPSTAFLVLFELDESQAQFSSSGQPENSKDRTETSIDLAIFLTHAGIMLTRQSCIFRFYISCQV